MGTSISEHLPRWPQPLVWALLALPGISLAGAIGAGMVSKWGGKAPLYEMHHESLIKLLSWAAVGTAALVSAALWRQWQQRHQGGSNREQWGAWLVAVIAALLTPLWLPLPALWGFYAFVIGAVLVPIRAFGHCCGQLKSVSVVTAQKAEKTLMGHLTRLLSGESWLRHHTSGLMMMLAVLLAALLMWEGQR